MTGNDLDIVLINPGDKKQIYQGLDIDLAAVEPPFWLAALAAYLRDQGFSVRAIDANAENFSPAETAGLVSRLRPLLSAVIVYGSQPSASTQNMTIATAICLAIRQGSSTKVAIGGLHPSALPERTLRELPVDFVIEGEGPYTLAALLTALKLGGKDLSAVPGLWYFDGDGSVRNNPRAGLIKDLDRVLSVAAWDLLPMDKYKAHNWHCFDDLDNRSPYAAIYTSLGCPYNCVFCCINALFGTHTIRYRDPDSVVREIGLLREKYGVRNLKIVDELFVLNEAHYMTIVDKLIGKNYGLNIWAYARVDTVKSANLSRMKQAGINWLALGIESANPKVRDGALKQLKTLDIKRVVKAIQDEGIRVIGNFIFGLPEDDLKTMRETLDLAIELNCEFANFYCTMAYPGSRLYEMAVKEGWELPAQWHGFSQHSYEELPLRTRYLEPDEVLAFRDAGFHEYFENPVYLDMIGEKFGSKARSHIQEMTKVRLKRKILEDGGARKIKNRGMR